MTGLIVTVSTLLGKTGTLVPSEGINRIKSATIDKKKKVKKDTRTLLKALKVALSELKKVKRHCFAVTR